MDKETQKYLDKRFEQTDKKFDKMFKLMYQGFDTVDKRFLKLEKKIDGLRISIDKFVTLYTRQEQEFTIIKEDIRKIKGIIKEKLGVDIDVA